MSDFDKYLMYFSNLSSRCLETWQQVPIYLQRFGQLRKLEGQIVNINSLWAAKVYPYFVVVWKKYWNDNQLYKVRLLQHFLQLRKLSWVACGPWAVYCTGLL